LTMHLTVFIVISDKEQSIATWGIIKMETRERAKREAEEARRIKRAEAKAKRKAAWMAREVAKIEAKEAKEKVKREAKEAKERAKRKAKEAKEKVKREAKEAKEMAKREAKEAKERAKRKAKEAKRAKQAEVKAKKEAGQAAREEVREEAREGTSAELYKGKVKLVVAPPVDLEQVRKFEEQLYQVQDLRLVLFGGSTDEGIEVVVSAEEPIPLIDVLREMPPVEQVVKRGKTIQIILKIK